jgi:2-hydroxychromene-2-carboxylate isomerase
MASPKLTIYIDVASAFAYLTYKLLKLHPLPPNVTVTFVPVFLGGIMRLTANRPPSSVPLKGAYAKHDLHRQAREYCLPIAPDAPSRAAGFPPNTLIAMRTVCAAQKICPNSHTATDSWMVLLDALLSEYWVNGRSVDGFERVTAIAEAVLGIETARQVMDAAQTDEIKAVLAANVEEAVGKGCFGLPYFVGEFH